MTVRPLISNRLLAALLAVCAAFLAGRVSGRALQIGASEGNGESKGPAALARPGGGAAGPTDVPPSGWRDILRRTWDEIGRDRVLAVAGGVVFYGLLGIVPALSAMLALYGLVADRASAYEHLALLESFVPGEIVGLLREQVVRIAEGGETTLGVAFVVGLALSLWSANAGVKATFDALNVAYGEEEKRGFVRLNLTSLAFTLGLIVFALIAIGVVAVLPAMLPRFGSGDSGWLIRLARWPAIVVVLMLVLALLYRFGPSRDQPQWRWISPGALAGAVGWLAASMLFSWYLASFADYNRTYGALGAVIALLVWLWISAIVVLVGAEINSEAERQTYRDTTVGQPKPVGVRGADAADRKL